ncbi:MAG: (d)CMP kinase [Bdellovibrionaceae bacterium]|nr:(d)CMP kinase [Pseudobdellovibrionaceae bacterium]
MGYVITIDGPAASGKSSVSRELSKKLGIPWVSTGAFYRGLAYVAQQMKTDLDHPIALSELCFSNMWKIVLTIEKTQVWFNEQDVTEKISHEDVGNIASKISHFPEVRQSLLDHQRNCALENKGLIAEGRDCGTVVFPFAEAKIYLTARSEDRAVRRAQELGLDKDILKAQQKQRDIQDSTRKVAPMQVPEDALVVDTSELTLEQVVQKAYDFAAPKIK